MILRTKKTFELDLSNTNKLHNQISKMTTFTANTVTLGNPNFLVVDIDVRQVAAAFQAYLVRGSQLTGVSLDDIDTGLFKLPSASATATLADLIECGMKLFDAIVWLTAGRPASHPLTVDPTKSADTAPSMHEIARAVFYTYFFLVTQARYPVGSTTVEQPAVPNFLSVVMGMTENQSVYINRLCSFSAQKFNPAWVKHVSFENLGQEALSRFGLGVAGYRMFGPFKLYTPVATLSPELRTAYEFARKVSTSAPTWDVHPLTRNPAVLTSRGNLNKNLNNLILDCFTREQITEMVTAKVLYKTPEREPNYMNYKTWSSEDNISGNTSIFRTA